MKTIYLEDNKGGDFLKLTPIGENDAVVEVGHQCVIVFKEQLPVAALTAALAFWHDAGRPLPWGEDYNAELRARMKSEKWVALRDRLKPPHTRPPG